MAGHYLGCLHSDKKREYGQVLAKLTIIQKADLSVMAFQVKLFCRPVFEKIHQKTMPKRTRASGVSHETYYLKCSTSAFSGPAGWVLSGHLIAVQGV